MKKIAADRNYRTASAASRENVAFTNLENIRDQIELLSAASALEDYKKAMAEIKASVDFALNYDNPEGDRDTGPFGRPHPFSREPNP